MNIGDGMMKRTLIRCAGAFAGALAITATLLAAGNAGAFSYRVNGAVCLPSASTIYAQIQNVALSNTSTTSTMDMACAAPDSTSLTHTAVVALNVHGYDSSTATSGPTGATAGSVLAQACVTFYASNSGSCGTIASTGNSTTGMYMLQPSLSSWQNPSYSSEFAWLFVRLPASNGGTGSSNLRGFWMSS